MEIQPPKDKAERDARLDLVMATIEANPKHWDQETLWHCGTSHCFAGFAQCLALQVPLAQRMKHVIAEGLTHIQMNGDLRRPPDDAVEWLGLDDCSNIEDRYEMLVEGSDALFEGANTLADLRRIVAEIKESPYPSPHTGEK